MAQICDQLAAQPVQAIGKILVIWREQEEAQPDSPEAKPARPAAKAAGGKRPLSKAATRSGRPRSPAPSPPRESEPRRRRPRTSR
jgi:hypothetical protein